ncbi:uncharacterized protein FIESC28_00429 [Fusarium coffeatum]|uniref:Methyltransferase domain-containing protein n=1 Tax=Fusarium coffeatum TaxID=231269 RepID=A0A366SD65_9HYPO|nr:uncharacterized protein FIESC28_00429 [Fusarium coffeatum]RBR26848.1 hypothetical protein FIESC28_00429 [Fusarium coffeatum]
MSGADSTTASITSSILQYRTIHGRTYHSEQGDAQYWGSNDDQQKDLMDLTHHILTLGLGDKLHLAPLKKENVQQAIDIGTGTGIWAIDFADQYPNATIVGTDLSPIQLSWAPPNLQFTIEDCSREWTFKSDFTDYIHARWLMGSIGNCDAFFWKAFRNPIGDWPEDPVEKQMGIYTKHGLQKDSEGFVLFMAHTLGWTREEILDYVGQFRKEIGTGKSSWLLCSEGCLGSKARGI